MFRVDRVGCLLSLNASWFESVSDPRFRQQIFRIRRVRFELLAQLTHEDAQVLGLLLRCFAPHRFEQLGVTVEGLQDASKGLINASGAMADVASRLPGARLLSGRGR